MASNRDSRRAFLAGHKFLRLTPLIEDDALTAEVKSLQKASFDLVVDVKEWKDVLIVRVPFNTSTTQAEEARHSMSAIFECPVLVVTENVTFATVTPCTPGEVADILKRYESGAKS